VTIEQVRAAIPQFIGKIEQTPPIYSAIQVNGQRLYKLARAGETVEVPSREVHIYSIDILNWLPGEYPEVEVQIACGGGTYIRSIARDLGARLGTRGVLAFLERNASCGFGLADSLNLEQLIQQQEAGTFTPISPSRGLVHLAAVTLADAELIKSWSQGKRLPLTNPQLSGYVRVVDDADNCLGVGEVRDTEEGKLLVPQTVLI
jgi:tRNA pseudouridine55 synthase